MKRLRSQSGYALLAALLVAVLAGTFALVIVVGVHALHLVESADGAGWRASRLEGDAASRVAGRLRWRPGLLDADLFGGDPVLREVWTAGLSVDPPAETRWPRRRVRIAASAGQAERRQELVVELRAEDWATGVSCSGDADIVAPFSVRGSGLYVGGCLRGRENVQFVAGGAGSTITGSPVDDARGGGLLPAAVHAGAAIFGSGVEIHAASDPPFPEDSDLHAGTPLQMSWVEGPSPEFLVAAVAAADTAAGAFAAGVLDLASLGPASGDELVYGRCLLLPRVDEVTVAGSAPADAGPVLVLVQGDAVVGQPGERVVLDGGLVVCGRLRVRGELELRGFLHARSLQISGRASVSVPAGWRDRPLAGATAPVIVESGV